MQLSFINGLNMCILIEKQNKIQKKILRRYQQQLFDN